MKLTQFDPSKSSLMYSKYQKEVCEHVHEINAAWKATGRDGSPLRELMILLAQMLAWAEDVSR